jgi:hypothetical protein
MNKNENVFLRAAVLTGMNKALAVPNAVGRWGVNSETARYIKAVVDPLAAGPDASGALTIGDLSRQQFVQAVFSQQILGQLSGLVRVPAITRINFETAPVQAAFSVEGTALPVAVGNVGVVFPDKRRIGILAVVSDELLQLTDESAEATVEGILSRAVTRGVDAAFVGSQARDERTPAGLATVATNVTGATLAGAFLTGVEAFTGDLTKASVLVNPLTAVTLRSPTETAITARGGSYGGMPAIASYGVPLGSLFIVDASRVIATVGDAKIDVAAETTVYPVPQATGDTITSAFQTGQRAVRVIQYVDWQFLPGAAVQASVAAS